MLTLGIEEEYLLLDPATALPVPKAEQICAAVDLEPVDHEREIQAELLQAQVEVATPVCADLAEASRHLLRLRHAVSSAAKRAGCRIAACGTAPRAGLVPVPVTRKPRYLAMRSSAAQLVDEQLINGMHVHVAIPDREMGVAALNRVRPWLPVLVAMAGNSPLWNGQDTGFASWRTVVYSRWPVSGPPPTFTDLADYEERVEALLATGTISDRGQLYWQARLSDRYPTIEVRCLDVQLRADDAVMFAGIVRGLVATAIRDEKSGRASPRCPQELLSIANWHAARYGLEGMLIDPEGRRRDADDVVYGMLGHIGQALEESGDLGQVSTLVHRLLRRGTPADRQRRVLATDGIRALTDLITEP
ncbi:glutamate--cysteine ligase [Streptomyces sp. UNOC14_S4]|uniref:carboxylate-amine ligase n=1 Tax=Streptomyces sp. UNOC14_S4 TaxID=2872340 RepID=UPI001E4865DA|nr:glutamate--cysteine ligase [Streptomyces sp. UNOC14_S4]MCC3770332.1 glutamate--cysteine ligase [Streptomyces sp. UNOC14_S4]